VELAGLCEDVSVMEIFRAITRKGGSQAGLGRMLLTCTTDQRPMHDATVFNIIRADCLQSGLPEVAL